MRLTPKRKKGERKIIKPEISDPSCVRLEQTNTPTKQTVILCWAHRMHRAQNLSRKKREETRVPRCSCRLANYMCLPNTVWSNWRPVCFGCNAYANATKQFKSRQKPGSIGLTYRLCDQHIGKHFTSMLIGTGVHRVWSIPTAQTFPSKHVLHTCAMQESSSNLEPSSNGLWSTKMEISVCKLNKHRPN